MHEIIQYGKEFYNHMMNWVYWFYASLIGLIFTLIGEPNNLLLLILILFISDFVTRIIAQMIKAGGVSPKYFIIAINKKLIQSKKFKEGLFVKVIFYFILLSVANLSQVSGLFIGNYIASTIYFALVFNDLISVIENMIDAGFSDLSWLLKKIKDKRDSKE